MKRAEAALVWLARRGLLVAVLGLVTAGYLLQLSASPVLTASMTPTFRPGDAVLTRTEPLTDLRVGQVVVLVPPGQVASFAHRVVSITGDPAHPAIRTQGDANSQPDPWTVRPTGPCR